MLGVDPKPLAYEASMLPLHQPDLKVKGVKVCAQHIQTFVTWQ